MQKRTDFFDNSLSRIVPDIPLVIRNKPHNNQLYADLSRLISAYPVVSHFLRFAWQTTTTDGLENASRRYSKSDIKRMIERQRSKYGWEFLFIGANIDAIVTAESFGIGQSRAVNYHADKKGTKVIYDAISAPLTAMRSKGRIDDNWSEEIEEDFNNRK